MIRAPEPPPDAQRPPGQQRGIACPRCGAQRWEVLATRRVWDQRIMRRRRCLACGRKVTTVERVV